MNVSSVGATQIEVRARIPGDRAAPRADQGAPRGEPRGAAREFIASESPIGYGRRSPERRRPQVGKAVALTGEVTELEEAGLPDGDAARRVAAPRAAPPRGACTVRLVQGAENPAKKGDALRVFGHVARAFPVPGRADIPEIEVDFALKDGKGGGKARLGPVEGSQVEATRRRGAAPLPTEPAPSVSANGDRPQSCRPSAAPARCAARPTTRASPQCVFCGSPSPRSRPRAPAGRRARTSEQGDLPTPRPVRRRARQRAAAGRLPARHRGRRLRGRARPARRRSAHRRGRRRALPDRRAPRPRRHGHRLQGRAHAHRQAAGDEAPAPASSRATPRWCGASSARRSPSPSSPSPNTVQVFDFGVSEGLTYLVMELVSGEDLGAHPAHAGADAVRAASARS